MTVINYTSTAEAVIWSPSIDRRFPLPAASAAKARGSSADTTVTLPGLPLGTRWDYSIDLSAQIAAGDTVTSLSVISITPTGLRVPYAGGWGTLAVFWAAGGTPGQVFALSLLTGTAQGRMLTLLATITVPAPGAAASPAVLQVVQVPVSYVDDAVAVVGAAANAARTEAAAATAAVSAIVTGTIVGDVVTTSATPTAVPDLPVIPGTGGYCWLQGTIVAQDQTTRDMAVWNVALAVRRTNGGGSCDVKGDSTPSSFGLPGTTTACAIVLGAGSAGPTITLTGLSESVTWGINLNSTTGD